MAYDNSYFGTMTSPYGYSATTTGGGGAQAYRQPPPSNTETRFVHIQDPEDYPHTKPIDEAVNTAFDDAHLNDVSGISPELLAKITQSVIHQLKTTGVSDVIQTPVTAVPPTNYQQPRVSSPESPSEVESSPARVYTPPSPQKHTEVHDILVDRLPPDSPSPPPAAPTQRIRSHSNVSMGPVPDGLLRPRPPLQRRQPTAEEATTLERIWGKLFDENGAPTEKLSQFLRGLATHLIEEMEPKNSLVVTPAKMIAFYQGQKVANEIYPWNEIFDDAQSSISRMYRALHIQHHLVQDEDHFDIRPDIPGLTAKGFERWQTMLIQAHPEEEFERLQQAAILMPINNPDDRKERFPKDIPRRLFPKSDSLEMRDYLLSAIETHAKITVSRFENSPTPRPETKNRRNSDETSHASYNEGSVNSDGPYHRGSIERERKPYSRIPPESAIDDLSTPTTSTPIERERKPYSAAPGGGKSYDDGGPLAHAVSHASGLPPPPSAPPGLQRSSSNSSRPINIPPPPSGGPSGHRMSTGEFMSPFAPHMREPIPRRRNQSPLGNDMRRSDNDVRAFQSASYDPPGYLSQGFAPPPPPPPPVVHQFTDPRYDDDRRYSRESDLRRENYGRGGSPVRRNLDPQSGLRAAAAEEEWYRRSRDERLRR